MANSAFDIPINFKLYADTEDEAIFVLQKFLHKAIIEFGLDREILEHDVIEYITSDPEANAKSCGSGCGNNNPCKGKCVQPTE